MTGPAVTLTPEERRAVVDLHRRLTTLRDEQGHPSGLGVAVIGLEEALRQACDHNPELHTLEDLAPDRWRVTCHACGASWERLDLGRLW